MTSAPPGPPPAPNSGDEPGPNRTALYALIGVGITAILSLITGITVAIINRSDQPPPPPSPPSTQAPSMQSTPNETTQISTPPALPASTGTATFTFTTPLADSEVRSGFDLAGTVSNLPEGAFLWLFTGSTYDSRELVSASDGPMATQNGPWGDTSTEFLPREIGERHYRAIQVDATCNDDLVRSGFTPRKSLSVLPESCVGSEVVARLRVQWVE